MNINFKKLLAKISPTALLLMPFTALAQDAPGFGNLPTVDNLPTSDLTILIISIVNWILGLAALVAVIFLIYGGFKYIISGGDSTQAEAAKNTIVYAIIGLIVIGLSWAIASFVISIFVVPTAA